jgi:ATP-binding cassette subfamily C (CFTR/MRP) protein 1
MSNLSEYDFEDDFCGGQFWNFSLLWDVEKPDFTGCFQKTIFSWIPLLVIIFFSLFEVPGYLSKHNWNRNIKLNLYNLAKFILIFCLIVVNVTQIGFFGMVDGDDDAKTRTIYPADYLFGAAYLTAHLISFCLLALSMKYGIRASFTQFVFYFVSVVCEATVFRSMILRDESGSVITTEKYLISCQFGLGLIMLILNFVADQQPSRYEEALVNLKNGCPEIAASVPSKLTFAWVATIIWKGFRNTLDTSMLWDLHPSVSSRGVVPIFDSFYAPSVEAAKQTDKLNKEAANYDPENTEKTKVSIFPALLKTFGYEFFLGSFFQALYSVLIVIGPPQIQSKIIDYVEDTAESGGEGEYEWKAYYFAGLLMATNIIISICNGQYFNKMYVISMKVRTALNSAIYRKAVKLSSTARKESTVGEIVNLMSVDVQRFMVKYL